MFKRLNLKPEDQPEDLPESARTRRVLSLPTDPDMLATDLVERLHKLGILTAQLREISVHWSDDAAGTMRSLVQTRSIELEAATAYARDVAEAMRIAQRRARSAAADLGAS